MDRFYIAETPVTRAAWEAFMEDEPFWQPDRREALSAAGLANSDYLKTGELEEAPPLDTDDSPFPGMSWFAAQAFCQWLNARLPENLGLEARLPREAEWEYAAKAGAFTPGLYWEWCEETFAPMDIFPSAGERFDPPSPERSVRGGSWVNRAGSVPPDTRASLPPDSCSPFVSFRPVLAVTHG
jgi:formylglycine-generating enzyme required for sulfatase activity